MVVLNYDPGALSASDLSLFYTTDSLLSGSPVLIFYGPTATSTHATHSRIQAHVFTPAGLQSFARLIISPTAAFYNAVTCLPREEQGDEICRGLAFSLYKYYAELPESVKDVWEDQYANSKLPSAPPLFSDAHAAMVATRMVRVDNVEDVITDVRHALSEQTLSWLDLDIVLPQASVQKPENTRESAQFDESEEEVLQQRYGKYAPLVKLFGEPTFLPTSKLRRAPSKPTSLNRSQTFTRTQKENLRREMCELLDTEENYVSKIHDLVHSVAVDFRQKAKHKSLSSSSPTEQALKALFPPSLDKILEVNSGFLEAIRVILEDTENDAIQDIETASDDIFVAPLRGQKDPPDVTGALAVAKALVEWFPKFGDSYADYMGAHGDFSQLLKVFMKDSGSSFSKRVYETGEQRLMSMLIEPVQRLPRYNLYIDNIVKQLPVRHPAIKPFLKARDIVSEICSREGPLSQHQKVLDRLRKIVFGLSPSFNPRGRLINAIEFMELSAPYHGHLDGLSTTTGIGLLFADILLLLHKPAGCNISARTLVADLDSSRFSETASGSAELLYHQQLKLSDVFLSEHSGGNILQIISPMPANTQPGRPASRDGQQIGIRMLYPQGAYEHKAHKFVEDVVKAKVEGRYSEAERESFKWDVRTVPGDLSYFSAICEEPASLPADGRGEPAKVQILVDSPKLNNFNQVGDNGVEMTVSISILEDGFYLVDITTINGYTARDKLTSTEFLPVLTKRLGNFLQLRNHIKNPALTEAYMFRNHQLLRSLRLELDDPDAVPDGKFRSPSPVKMLSSFFGGSVGKEGGSRKLQRNPQLGEIPRMAPPLQPVRTHSRDGELPRPTSSSSRNIAFNANAIDDPIVKLEETLATILLALHARKGNIVGRSVRARNVADELLVNEVYNSLLENPSNIDLLAQSSVDVLFAAFEKFLNFGWRIQLGPVVSHATLVSLQMKSDSMYPGEFEDFFRTTLSEMAPHSQRALREIIKLLADLLDGTSNDGDRGILTAAFAEILVPEGNANEFISLMDRFIQDIDALFPIHNSGTQTPNYGSVDSKTRGAAGSLNSNTSLRRRFGFGNLSRENSKSENESKVGSLWRSLSKNTHGVDGQQSSVSKAGPGHLGRSNSTDATANLRASPKRPSSRDRPTVLGAFPFEGGQPSPHNKSYTGGLGTIGEVPPPTTGPPRKKRRSSLSDLKTLQDADDAPTWSPQTPRKDDSSRPNSREESLSPRTSMHAVEDPVKRTTTPSPPKHSSIPTPLRLGSPIREEFGPSSNTLERGAARPKSSHSKSTEKDEVTIKSHAPMKKRGQSVSAIPTLRSTGSGLTERPTSGNTVKIPPSTPRSPTKSGSASPKKLKMQSPQKLRERLQNQQRDIETASKDLQQELSLIGHELTSRGTPRLMPQSSAPQLASPGSPTRTLESRIATLEKHLKVTLETLSTRSQAIAQDVSSSLQVSEARAKHLDQLYRDMNAENEALYARFNEELEKVERSVRKGKGNEEIDSRMRASEEETARLRKENARLKREVAGLKAQIRE
ncbi:hypothetical protein BS50DRAFT_502912 [Corynespora cassiicola Philippines]|uniref:DH domain-containing protein n=1 Tax=Corynespora cassiicola Philippines TaxID=1448308 RepID=A0A2T2NAC5_CORCC|nr:hypothetical protein BS50DRAFT_502912 [Corynespora cassiicola Philippines]